MFQKKSHLSQERIDAFRFKDLFTFHTKELHRHLLSFSMYTFFLASSRNDS